MSAFSARAELYRKLYLTGPGAQVLRTVLRTSGARAIVSLEGDTRQVVHFGSNNYLGLANHPLVVERAKAALDRYGLSVCGSPLLNGATDSHRELERRLAKLKGTEDAILFPSGYAANLAWTQALIRRQDRVLFDSFAHTSFLEGVKHLSCNNLLRFHHNLPPPEPSASCDPDQHSFVFVEGVYSMHGDIAPIEVYSGWCQRNCASLVVDDAHGTGTLGRRGRGVFEHHNLSTTGAIIIGTLSKALGGNGGFICASSDIVLCLRASGNSSIFSASLPPATVAGLLAALEVLDKEPERVETLQKNIAHFALRLGSIGVPPEHASPIFSIPVPKQLNIQNIVRKLHAIGFYVNGVSYPALPRNEQRVRVSLSAEHSISDLDGLAGLLIDDINVHQ